jgi:capsular polysaccharide transport system permease protein
MAQSLLKQLARGWSVQIRVIHALMIRELTTRFGRENIGFLWIMVEPLLFAGLVGLIWQWTKGPEEHGVTVIAFAASGYIPITLFRHGIGRSISAFTANGSLLYHRQVKVLDFILARFIIEVLGGMMAFVFALVVLASVGEIPVPDNIGTMIAGWTLYAMFCLSLCLVITPLSEMSEVIEKLVPVITYITIPISGLPYMVSWMTPGVREILLWSPFVNGMEMIREGIWGDKVTAYYNIWNPIVFSMILTLIGLALCRRVRRELAVE